MIRSLLWILSCGLLAPTVYASPPSQADSHARLRQVVHWAVGAASLGGSELQDAIRRARRSAAVPELQLRYAYALGDTFRASLDGSAIVLPSALDSSQAERSDHRAEGSLRWRLSDLVFHRAEPRLLSQAQRRARLRLGRHRGEAVVLAVDLRRMRAGVRRGTSSARLA